MTFLRHLNYPFVGSRVGLGRSLSFILGKGVLGNGQQKAVGAKGALCAGFGGHGRLPVTGLPRSQGGTPSAEKKEPGMTTCPVSHHLHEARS